MTYIIGLLLGTLLVSTWSYQRGTGFWFGFLWSFLLSPVLGAVLVLVRRPRGRTLVQGGELLDHDPSTPRPLFCAIAIAVVFCLILIAVEVTK